MEQGKGQDTWPKANWWDRHIAPKLINCACSMPQVMKRRSQIVPRAYGRVLELGAGGGINLQFYDADRVEEIVGIDPSVEMISLVAAHRSQAPVPFRIERAMAEQLPFADHSFDTVLVTFTLCSVSDQLQSLREARRVLKPGGRLLFLEHGRAPDPKPARWQRRIEPVWKRLGGGCHLTRPVIEAVEACGFHILEERREYTPKTPQFLGWTESGMAVPVG